MLIGINDLLTFSNIVKHGSYDGNDLATSDISTYDHDLEPAKKLSDSSNATILSLTDIAIDHDNNEYYDFIRFDAQIEVFNAGIYELRIELQNIDGIKFWHDDFYVDINAYKDLELGTHILSQYFDSAWIHRQKFAQKFNVSTLELVKKNPDQPWERWDYQVVERHTDYGMTQEYDPADFDPPELLFNNYGSSYPLDSDSPLDGLFDYLVFEINVTVFIEGYYEIEGELKDMNGYWLAWRDIFEGYLDEGIHTLKLRFDSQYIFETQKIQSYELNHFRIYFDTSEDDWSQYWQQIDVIGWGPEGSANTNILDYHNFQKPVIRLTHNYYDHGWDSTPDRPGFSGLVVKVEVNITKTNDYFVYLFFFNNKTGDGQWLTSEKQRLDQGIRNITVVCDDTSWLLSQLDASSFQIRHIHLYVNRVDFDDQGYEQYDNIAYTLRQYSESEFDIPDIILTGYYAEHIIDADSDDLIDAIKIDVGIEVIVDSAEVWVEGWLGNESWNDMACGWYHSGWYEPRLLSQGIHTLSLRFEAGFIRDFRVNSLLSLHNVMVVRTDQGWHTTDFLDHSIELSQVINWIDCEAPLVSVENIIGESLVDTDDNGLFDYLGISIEFFVREANEYHMTSSLFYSDGQDFRHNWIDTPAHFKLGYNTIMLYWPCMNLDRGDYSEKWTFELRDIQIVKQKGYVEQEGDRYKTRTHGPLQQNSGSHHWYRTDTLDLSKFERFPVESFQVISAEPVDFNYDTYFDFIQADFQINSSASGDYYFEAVLADWTDGWDEHLEWRGKYINLTQGQNFVTLYYSGCHIHERGIVNAQYGIEGFTLYKYYTDLEISLIDEWGVDVFRSDWNNWYYLLDQYDYSNFSSLCYEDPNHPELQSVTFNGAKYSGDHYQVLVGTELVIETKISNPEQVSEVYCQIDGHRYFIRKTKPGVYVCKKLMGISGIDSYGIHIIIRDIYGNDYWSDWFEVKVVEEYVETTGITETTGIMETTNTGTEEAPKIGGVSGFEIAILLAAVTCLALAYNKRK